MNDKFTQNRIIEAADQLFYQRGYEHTSFADIAKAVEISRGNFYHHFKSKDKILSAVIDHRLSNTEKMLMEWEAKGDRPEDRILCYIRILFTNGDKIKRYGCPVGTLSTELAKLKHSSKTQADRIFTLFRTWLSEQFIQLGFKKVKADEFAMHILSWSQGAATMFSAYHDERFVKWEIQHIESWLKSVVKMNRRAG